jgi:hypothetical protein
MLNSTPAVSCQAVERVLQTLTITSSVEMTIVDTWGYPDKDGNWSGLTGYLQRRQADIGTTGMFVTKERLPFVRYIASTSVTK